MAAGETSCTRRPGGGSHSTWLLRSPARVWRGTLAEGIGLPIWPTSCPAQGGARRGVHGYLGHLPRVWARRILGRAPPLSASSVPFRRSQHNPCFWQLALRCVACPSASRFGLVWQRLVRLAWPPAQIRALPRCLCLSPAAPTSQNVWLPPLRLPSSQYPVVNDTVGFIFHTALLVPYFSWVCSFPLRRQGRPGCLPVPRRRRPRR